VTAAGTLVLVGGGEFTPACTFDRELLERSGTNDVLVLPTAGAFEHPERAVAAAEAWFAPMGATVRSLPVLARPDAFVGEHAEAMRASRFVYVTGGSPMHLRSVLKDTPVLEALAAVVDAGGVLVASGAGAMVLSDPMVDPRGGAFTLGLGLIRPVAVIPQVEQWSADRLHRTLALATDDHDLTLLALESGAAAIRGPDGTWSGRGRVTVYRGHTPVSLDALPS
jgi:cyanophycinase